MLDAHDDEERAAVRALINELPPGHEARVALEQGADALALTHLVPSAMAARLKRAWLDGYGRMLRRQANFRP